MTYMDALAGDPGALADFDLNRVPSPCFVVDAARVEANLQLLARVGEQSGATILAALKAFSMWSLAPMVSKYLAGACASGLWEARLAREAYGGEVATYAAGFKANEIDEIVRLSDHVIFNSPVQKDRFAPRIAAAPAGERPQVGLRINPEHREVEVAKYDPCAPGSRLGLPISQLQPGHLSGVDGIHLHTLCEQTLAPLQRTWAAVGPRLEPYFDRLKWINFGGGHHITRADYEVDDLIVFLTQVGAQTGCRIYLEPGEAIALDTGILVGEVLDTIENDGPVAILDVSATCHMPDVLEAPYRPELLGESARGVTVRLGGPSCLAGDMIGHYVFADLPRAGDRLAFLDQAHYTMVKATTFNGVRLPAIALWDSRTDDLKIVRQFTFDDFKTRLS
jgi:carboxynorspermidine decarboxylase